MNTQTRYFILSTFVSTLLAPLASANTEWLPSSIVILTSDEYAFTGLRNAESRFKPLGISVTVYNFDDAARFDSQLNKGMPADANEAKRLFEQRLKKIGQDTFNQTMTHAHQALINSIQFQVERYPVVIFDNNYAVYGVTDVSAAIDIFLDYQESFHAQGRQQ